MRLPSIVRAVPSFLATATLAISCRRMEHEPTSTSSASASSEHLNPAPSVVTGSSVGQVRIGMPLDSLAKVAPVVQDTTELDNEGNPQRIARVGVGGDTITAEVVDNRVWRLRVVTSGPATADGISVGSPASSLATSRAVIGAVGEGKIYVLSPARCGLSFGLPAAIVRPTRQLDSAAIAHLPPTAVIDEILVLGCRRPAP